MFQHPRKCQQDTHGTGQSPAQTGRMVSLTICHFIFLYVKFGLKMIVKSCFPSSNVRIFSVWMVAFSAVWRSLSYNNMADIFFLLSILLIFLLKKKKKWSWQSLRIIYLYLRCYTKIFYSRRLHKER